MGSPRRYNESGSLSSAAMTSSNKTLIDVVATAAIRPALYDFSVGTSGTPADNVVVWQVQRFTASGTRTGVTPTALDSGDPASTGVSGQQHTVEPTYTTEVWRDGMNQRASYRWVAAPGGEIVCPATASNGVGIAAKSSAYTGDAIAQMMHAE